jgi:hypothetical protein
VSCVCEFALFPFPAPSTQAYGILQILLSLWKVREEKGKLETWLFTACGYEGYRTPDHIPGSSKGEDKRNRREKKKTNKKSRDTST